MPPTRGVERSPLPGADLDLQDADVVADLFQRAADANLASRHRRGCLADLPPQGSLVVTGDLHDHGLNLLRILQLAKLQEGEHRHVVLHEMIHSPRLINGRDLSVRTLARIAALKIQHPHQVHLMLGNHELSQLHGFIIHKDGVNVVGVFNAGLRFLFDRKWEKVDAALRRFLRSLLLAVRCPNGIFVSHSLPASAQFATFDPFVIHRDLSDADLQRGGSAYDMVWGRDHDDSLLEELADDWNVRLFIIGHQPTLNGYEVINDHMLVVSSDDQDGTALPLELTRPYTMADLTDAIVHLADMK